MSDTQEPADNAVGKVTSVVREEDTAAALNHVTGDKFPAVLSTTRTIALLEVAAGSVLAQLCLAHQLSVGVDVNVKHLAATLPGATVTATARYTGRSRWSRTTRPARSCAASTRARSLTWTG